MSEVRTASFGLIGLGVMGRNLAANLFTQGLAIQTYSYGAEERSAVAAEFAGLPIKDDLDEFLQALAQPRTIMLMVTAGAAVDEVLDDLLPRLEVGDTIIDGGNSLYLDSERRVGFCADRGVHFIGAGISGGEEGARHGASIMVGGDLERFQRVEPMIAALATNVGEASCHGYLGRGGAGHFVKMVHNGIEYGFMQLIAEVYEFMRLGMGLSTQDIQLWFERQKGGPLDSYLMDITARVMSKQDDLGSGLLLEKISDQAAQKGTGRWCVEASLDYGVPLPVAGAAVAARQLSNLVDTRADMATAYELQDSKIDTSEDWQSLLADALYGGVVTAFAEGLALISQASSANDWGTDVNTALKLWRGGCIIRAAMLDDMLAARNGRANDEHLLVAPEIARRVSGCVPAWQHVTAAATSAGIAMPAMSAALNYVTALSAGQLPTNLIQAQRDYFGAHTYERTDQSGTFHTQWEAKE